MGFGSGSRLALDRPDLWLAGVWRRGRRRPTAQPSLAQAVAVHAARIPPTLVYARAQNNNHLLSEAAGLYTAGLFLPDHPDARRWRDLGWRWFNHAIQSQVAADGAYMQHSTNYHRLMLQTGLWVSFLAARPGAGIARRDPSAAGGPRPLAAESLLDPLSGERAQPGPKRRRLYPASGGLPTGRLPPSAASGSRRLPGRAPPFAPGPWDEMAIVARRAASRQNRLYLASLATQLSQPIPRTCFARRMALPGLTCGPSSFTGRPDMPTSSTWTYGGAARTWPRTPVPTSITIRRPGITPWQRSEVHNTLSVDGQDQMTLAGRFLCLDWAQAQLVER